MLLLLFTARAAVRHTNTKTNRALSTSSSKSNTDTASPLKKKKKKKRPHAPMQLRLRTPLQKFPFPSTRLRAPSDSSQACPRFSILVLDCATHDWRANPGRRVDIRISIISHVLFVCVFPSFDDEGNLTQPEE